MNASFQFDSITLPPEAEALRAEVRAFLRDEVEAGSFKPGACTMHSAFDPSFSRKVGARGWIGMTWPKQYGGHGRSQLERYVLTEEFLAAGAPVRAHWVADRQSGPVLLKYATEAVKREVIPKIVAGELYFCIGLSEPNSGSDMFAAATKAVKGDGGWTINGRKVWTSNAHRTHYAIALIRTSPPTTENRRHGLTQFLVDMKTPGITIRPIINVAGHHDFNEVIFDDVFVPDSHVVGQVDKAWMQATDELAYERSGPDRWTETLGALRELIRIAGNMPGERVAEGIGREVAQLASLRRMSLSVAGMLQAGKMPVSEAAVIKDLATNWEQALPNKVRLLAERGPASEGGNLADFEAVMRYTTLIAPKLTIQGGTREVLRGIIARGLGLR